MNLWIREPWLISCNSRPEIRGYALYAYLRICGFVDLSSYQAVNPWIHGYISDSWIDKSMNACLYQIHNRMCIHCIFSNLWIYKSTRCANQTRRRIVERIESRSEEKFIHFLYAKNTHLLTAVSSGCSILAVKIHISSYADAIFRLPLCVQSRETQSLSLPISFSWKKLNEISWRQTDYVSPPWDSIYHRQSVISALSRTCRQRAAQRERQSRGAYLPKSPPSTRLPRVAFTSHPPRDGCA